jgi:hypothetical protein
MRPSPSIAALKTSTSLLPSARFQGINETLRTSSTSGQVNPQPEIRHYQPETTPRSRTRSRRPGGGRKKFFTDEEITNLRARYRKLLDENPKIEDKKAIYQLSLSVPAEKRGPEHEHNYRRHVFKPVRGKRRTTK